ncbi:MAG: hypothetical protein AAGE52_37600 [Myxococcota bacterium]
MTACTRQAVAIINHPELAIHVFPEDALDASQRQAALAFPELTK